MRLWDNFKRGAKAVTAPGIFLGLVAYFLWSATQGDRGLQAAAQRRVQLERLRVELRATEADEKAWQRRVAEMKPLHLDPDMLDERARVTGDYAEAGDIIVKYQPSQRLFTPADR